MSLRTDALDYANAGRYVFIADAKTKRPRTPHGLLNATRDERVIRAWSWDERDAGVAIRTGSLSDLVVIDVDGEDGEDSLRELERLYGALPGPTVLTPHGTHRWLAYPPGVSVIRNSVGFRGLPHVDIRADGGYVLAPSTPGYVFELSAPATPAIFPAALVNDVERPHPNGVQAIPQGARNSALASLAGTMRRAGMSEAAIAAALIADNRERCHPPLDEREVMAIAKSVSRYPPEVRVETRASK
jgi:bifunctional DNA primase/polymerase-like protein/primase-like protein